MIDIQPPKGHDEYLKLCSTCRKVETTHPSGICAACSNKMPKKDLVTDTLLPKNDDLRQQVMDVFVSRQSINNVTDLPDYAVHEVMFGSDVDVIMEAVKARDTKMLEHVIGADVSIDEAKSLAKVRRDGTNGTKFAHDPSAVVKADAINDDHEQQRERAKQWLGGSK